MKRGKKARKCEKMKEKNAKNVMEERKQVIEK